MKLKISKSIRFSVIALLMVLLNQGLFAQSLKKTFKYLESYQLELASSEIQKFSEDKIKSKEDLILYNLANSLLVCNEKYQKYDPYKALIFFEKASKIEANKSEIEKFLAKFTLSFEKVHDMIYQSILSEAKKINTEKSYQKALDVCKDCFYKADIIKLKETAAYIEAKNSKSISSYKNFITSYPTSGYVDEVKGLLEELAFKGAKINISVASLNQYINEYSSSKNSLIPTAIHLRDSIAFSKLNKSYSEYVDFTKKYPNSEYIKVINQELSNVLYEQATASNNIELLEFFLKEYPNDKRIENVNEKLELLFYKSLLDSRSSELFANFRRKFPNSNYIKELEQNIEGEYETFKDSRDGVVYKTIRIGNQVWMAENLRYEGVEHAPLPYENGRFDSGPINNYSKIYGNAYTAKIALNVCPTGWHLPSKAEWEELFIHVSKNAHEIMLNEDRLYKWENIAEYLINRKEFSSFHSENTYQSKFNVLATGRLWTNGQQFIYTQEGERILMEVVDYKGYKTNFWTSTFGARNYYTVNFRVERSSGGPLALVEFHDESLRGDEQFIRCVQKANEVTEDQVSKSETLYELGNKKVKSSLLPPTGLYVFKYGKDSKDFIRVVVSEGKMTFQTGGDQNKLSDVNASWVNVDENDGTIYLSLGQDIKYIGNDVIERNTHGATSENGKIDRLVKVK